MYDVCMCTHIGQIWFKLYTGLNFPRYQNMLFLYIGHDFIVLLVFIFRMLELAPQFSIAISERQL